MFLHTISDSLLITACVISASLNSLIKPIGRPSLVADVKQNGFKFSPVLSGVSAIQAILTLIHWRLARIADTYSALYVIGRLYFDGKTPGKKQLPPPGGWRSIARRALLLAITLPCYVTVLLRIDGHWWMKLFVTCLVAEAVLVDVFLSFVVQPAENIWLRRNWPAQTFLGKGDVDGHGLPMHHSETLGVSPKKMESPSQTDTKKSDTEPQPPVSGGEHHSHGLCDVVQQFWSTPDSLTSPEAADNQSRIFLVLGHNPTGWKCSHYRCRAHYTMKLVTRFISKLYLPGEVLALAWLVKQGMHTFAVRFADYLLSDQGSAFTCKLLFFMVVDYTISIVVSRIWVQIWNNLPGFESIRQRFREASRAVRWPVYVLCALVYYANYFILVRPTFSNRTVLAYLVDGIAFILIVFGVFTVISCVVRVRERSRSSQGAEPLSQTAEEPVTDGIETSGTGKEEEGHPGESPRTGGERQDHDQSTKDVQSQRRKMILTRLLLVRFVIVVSAAFIWLLQRRYM